MGERPECGSGVKFDVGSRRVRSKPYSSEHRPRQEWRVKAHRLHGSGVFIQGVHVLTTLARCGACFVLGRLQSGFASLLLAASGHGMDHRHTHLKRHIRPTELPPGAPHLRYGPHHRVLDEAGVRHTASILISKSSHADAALDKLYILIAEPGWLPLSARSQVDRGVVLCRNSPWLPGVGCFDPS